MDDKTGTPADVCTGVGLDAEADTIKPDNYIATVEAEALQLTSASAASIVAWLGLADRCCFPAGVNPITGAEKPGYLLIPTPVGDVRADLGDYVVLLSGGAAWPCKPEIFTAAYRRQP
ncbi:hypothetical protein Mkiyose1665_41550 [Mycobacterium kiyosense]|uniref:Uncharacterized protein n=1 Tax=Mycobacterium kiyosense TaxID=2871094 RepID=A0A9P3Q6K5_9MYCO|nr:hypothetical protein [Mycobacterium kiyosense]BDE16148.1 hypothetical protein MKCMC460_50080 [Mycobacterium sp. 20KCMC460]BDB44646.1 hypothetical protein IWGMT90018_50920 [Mycobacterium kiyosense]GLB82181.1 hypothetical protein SRL2020028_14370 [Mycobacterium kiyosense]GLB91627.1 hypothetical protein SRL2020130_44440 [Mycobacterium kiyosense]GLB95323.1 hypothetical protein SRL2020226_20990 [Mycobacterium kiyosense]